MEATTSARMARLISAAAPVSLYRSQVAPLANNGGPTFTMALASNSPAIDWAPIGGAPMTDQRGLMRPVGSGIDLGAFEFGAALPPLSTPTQWGDAEHLVQWRGRGKLQDRKINKSLLVGNDGKHRAMSTNGTVSRSYPTVPRSVSIGLTLDP